MHNTGGRKTTAHNTNLVILVTWILSELRLRTFSKCATEIKYQYLMQSCRAPSLTGVLAPGIVLN